ncbi:MAG TPA: NAD-dependent epimerase/dehydratase family protein [Gemmatimonadaceae bacterium]|nr:NAD-dependent epimerase/dehydratase family protein [Gemmatimonadaceae bacterium]
MTERALVTGGAGFIGSYIVDALLAAGWTVTVLDSMEAQVHGAAVTGAPAYLNRGAEFVRGDVRDRELVGRLLDRTDVVFYDAALVGVGQSMYDIARYVSGNALAAAEFLELVVARRDRIRKMIVASSMSCYGEGLYVDRQGHPVPVRPRPSAQLARQEWELRGPDGSELTPRPTPEDKPLAPTSIYAVTKRDHEEMFLSIGVAYKIPTVALRYFNVFGPRQALSNPYTGVAAIFSSRLLNGAAPVVFEDGCQSRDFVHATDIAQANLLAATRAAADYQVLNVGGGRRLTIGEVGTELWRRISGKDETRPKYLGQFREGDIRHCFADIARARALLGYEPRTSFEDGLDELIEWVAGQRAADGFERAHQELVARGLVG